MNKKVASLLGLLLLSNAAQAELVGHRNAWGSQTHSTVLYDDRYIDGYDFEFSDSATGVFLVSDGGAALPSNVSTPGFIGALSLFVFAGLRRRRQKR